MEYLVYKHTSPSGKSYIGITNNYTRRCYAHRDPNSGCAAFAAAVKKYGWNNFTHEILVKGITLDEANTLETKFILEYDTLSPNGYNLTTGGGVTTLSEETRQKISKSNTGKKHTDEAKQKIAAYRKGKPTGTGGRGGKGGIWFVVTDPAGAEHRVNNLHNFCKQNGLTSTNMYDVAKGRHLHHKGWKCKYAGD